MKLYYFETPNSRKVCAVAKYLDAPVDYIAIDLSKGQQRTPAFLAINPNGKVPALEDGPRKLWESNAIMCYLAEKAGSPLWPDDERRIDVLRWMFWEVAHFAPHTGSLFFQNLVKKMLGMGDPDPAIIQQATQYFRQYATVLNNHLKDRAYVVGDALTVADFAIAAVLPDAGPAGIPIDEFPEIVRWHSNLSELDAWRDPFPRQPAAA